MGNGRSRYAGDFASNVSATGLEERREERHLSWTMNRQGVMWAMPHQRGIKSERGMID